MNDPNCPENACSIEKVCRDYMLNDRLGQAIDRLAELLISTSAGKCTSVDYQTNTLAPLLNLSYTPDGLRAWRYQIHCKEFGFFRTCDPGTECVFTKDPHVNNVDRDFDQCERVFGISAAEIEGAVDETNAYYGGWNPSGTRILWVSGSIDPWHALSVCRTPDCSPLPGQPVLWVEGASHHFWTLRSRIFHPAFLRCSASGSGSHKRTGTSLARRMKTHQFH